LSEPADAIITAIERWRPGAVIGVCRDEGCSLTTDGIPAHVILKGEALLDDWKMCDCIIFISRQPLLIVMAELKSKTVSVTSVMEKLTNATDFVQVVMGHLKVQDYSLVHVVLARRWDTSEYRVLTCRRVQCGGKRHPVIPRRCGDRLAAVLQGVGIEGIPPP